jgi:hypothetical protein
MITWKRKLLVEHFFDTSLLVGMEFTLNYAVDLAHRLMPSLAELASWVHLITKWGCVTTLLLFAVEFLAVFAVSSFSEIREILERRK